MLSYISRKKKVNWNVILICNTNIRMVPPWVRGHLFAHAPAAVYICYLSYLYLPCLVYRLPRCVRFDYSDGQINIGRNNKSPSDPLLSVRVQFMRIEQMTWRVETHHSPPSATHTIIAIAFSSMWVCTDNPHTYPHTYTQHRVTCTSCVR